MLCMVVLFFLHKYMFVGHIHKYFRLVFNPYFNQYFTRKYNGITQYNLRGYQHVYLWHLIIVGVFCSHYSFSLSSKGFQWPGCLVANFTSWRVSRSKGRIDYLHYEQAYMSTILLGCTWCIMPWIECSFFP